MNIKTIKIFRTISKVILWVVVLGLVGFGGYYLYLSIMNRPENVVITNVTDASATVTWTTKAQSNGVVYYKENEKRIFPGILAFFGAKTGYDDRDVSDAQTACVNEFNKEASENVDEDFNVGGDNFDCEDARVTGMGKYYTHSVTMTNLKPETKYSFVVGDGIWSFRSDVTMVTTFDTLGEVDTPMPVFGRIIGDDDTYSRDSLVYITFRDGSEEQDSIIYSSTGNDDGGWYVDAATARDTSGNVLELELTNDTFFVKGRYSNYGESDEELYFLGYFNGAYPDVVVSKTTTTQSSLWKKFVLGAYAEESAYTRYWEKTVGTEQKKDKIVEACPKCATSLTANELYTIASGGTLSSDRVKDVGYGNIAKAVAATQGGSFSMSDLSKLGISQNAGNMNALVSTGVETFKVGSTTQTNQTINYSSNGNVENTSYTTTETYKSSTTTCTSINQCSTTTNYSGPGATGTDTDGAGGENIRKLAEAISQLSNYVDWTPQMIKNFKESCQENPDSEQCSNFCVSSRGANTLCTEICEESFSKEGFLYTLGDKDIQNIEPKNSDGSYKAYTSVGVIKLTESEKYAIENGGYVSISLEPVSLPGLVNKAVGTTQELINKYPALEDKIQKELEEMDEKERYKRGFYSSIYSSYCAVLGGTQISYQPCEIPSEDTLGIFSVSKVYADASTVDGEYLALYLPEYGLYSFQLGDYTMESKVVKGDSRYVFYLEVNDQDGFQMPSDPDNPTSEEDIILDSSAYEITYKQESSAQQYDISEGINILSFNFVPVSPDDLGAYMASDLITQAANNGVNIEYISIFSGGRWYSGYSCSSGTCTGTNFSIVPGKGYVVKASNSGNITVPGYNLTSSVPIPFSSGWNLVGVHGYTTAYTARTFIDSINTVEGLTANNVSWWPTSKGKYEGLEVENGTEYGLDFAISPTNGYFVRISDYAPTDTTCKSILWNAGGTANGTCGNTK